MMSSSLPSEKALVPFVSVADMMRLVHHIGIETALSLLAEVSTGYPVLLAEMTLLTALRTAATSAMAARHLAPRGNRTMAMIGNGAQAEFQALAMKAVVGIDHVRLYDIDPQATAK